MHCQYCGEKTKELVPYRALNGFSWTDLCQSCRWNLKLEDWNEACRHPKENHAVNQT